MPGVRPPVQHHGDREPERDQAQRRDRAVQPGEDRRRAAQGLPGPSGHRCGSRSAGPAGRGDHPRDRCRAGRGANDIKLAILPPLRELDEVAYLRFASVYQAFESLDDFETAITLLKIDHHSEADAK